MATGSIANMSAVDKYGRADAEFITFVTDHADTISSLEKTYPIDAAKRIVRNISDDILVLVNPLLPGKGRPDKEARQRFCNMHPYVAMVLIADGLIQMREDHELKIRGQMDLLTEMINLGKTLKKG